MEFNLSRQNPFLIIATLVFNLIVGEAISAQQLDLTVSAESAILMNADTGAILYEKEAHTPRYPASITKILTALYALEKAGDDLDVPITAEQDCIGTVTEAALKRSNYTMPAYLLTPDGSHIGIKRGEILTFRDLLYGMMLASGDDAANVIAKYVGGTVPQFMEEVNEYIKELGCHESVFMNPHGLHHPKQVTTAYDMGTLARAALKNPQFCEIVSTVRYTRPKTNKQEPYVMMQTNRLLRSGPYHYPKAIGIKTGYYSLAGSTLVSAARDGDRTLIAVLLKNNNRQEMFLDARKLFEAAFSQPKVRRTIIKQGPQKFLLSFPEASKSIKTYTSEDLGMEYYPAEEPRVKCLIYWEKGIKLPIAKGQAVGEVVVESESGQLISKTTLYAQHDAEASMLTHFKSAFGFFKGHKAVKILMFSAFLAMIGLCIYRLRRR